MIPRSVNAKARAAKEVEVDVGIAKVKQHMCAFDVKANKAAVEAASFELDKRKAEVTEVEVMETRKDEVKAVVKTANLPLSKGTVKVHRRYQNYTWLERMGICYFICKQLGRLQVGKCPIRYARARHKARHPL